MFQIRKINVTKEQVTKLEERNEIRNARRQGRLTESQLRGRFIYEHIQKGVPYEIVISAWEGRK